MENKICLVMIVKNESAVILDCLRSISPMLTSWSISDTGSTDDTKEIIQKYFDEQNIPGKIWEDKWENFGKNRTLAFEHAKDVTVDGYYFVIDADSSFQGKFIFPTTLLSDAYTIPLEHENTRYRRLCLFKASLDWIYRGVLHEYPDCLNKKFTTGEMSFCSIKDRRTGFRNQDPLKYQKDALLLENEIKISPTARNCFYLAQSYRDAQNLNEAKRWYLRRIGMGGWKEEVYISYINLYKMETEEKQKMLFLKHALKSVFRLEALTYLMRMYRMKNKSKLSFEMGLIGLISPVQNHNLFRDANIYDYEFFDEMSLAAADQCRYYMSGVLISMMKNVPENHRERILKNKKWVDIKSKNSLMFKL